MSNSKSLKKRRIFEMLLLFMTIIAYPLLFLGLSIMVLFFTLNNGFIPGIVLCFIFLFLGILWNTKYGVGGAGFLPALKNYLKNEETDDDIKLAWLSGILVFGIFIILFLFEITFN